jgi:phosphatidylethanolamine-binding protein (PEBP) family uncharacterized protein
MRRQSKAILRTALLSALVAALAACGSSSPARTGTTATPANLDVKSPAMVGERIPARYTCDGQGISPPLEWGAVPPNVRQLALFLVGYRPKSGKEKFKVSVEWAVAGLSPSLHRLAPNQLPAGAHVGVASAGHRYTLCPAKGATVHYQFELYGVPASVSIPAHFSGLALLSQLTAPSGPTRANAYGGFVAIYSRA